jgi:hypothetical protein
LVKEADLTVLNEVATHPQKDRQFKSNTALVELDSSSNAQSTTTTGTDGLSTSIMPSGKDHPTEGDTDQKRSVFTQGSPAATGGPTQSSDMQRSTSPDHLTAPEVDKGADAPIVVDPEVAHNREELGEISAQRARLGQQLHALTTCEQDLRRAFEEREGTS